MRIKTHSTTFQDDPQCLRLQLLQHFTKLRPTVKSFFQTNSNCSYPTNYGLTLQHPYTFLLLHLKKTPTSQNKIGIRIPQICIFYNQAPLDVLYSDSAEIKGIKTNEKKVKMNEVYQFFKYRWRKFNPQTTKEQQIIACFQTVEKQQRMQMLTDIDLLITCQLPKKNVFYQKIRYLRNKLDVIPQQIQVQFDEKDNHELAGLAVDLLTDPKKGKQEKLLREYGQTKYLQLCNQKISMFFNYQHNIRIQKATYVYMKNQKNQYYLTNVKNLVYHNFTPAIRDREIRRQIRDRQRNARLIMSSQKQQDVIKYQHKPRVKLIENQMNKQVRAIAKSFNVTIQNNQAAQTKALDRLRQKFNRKKASINIRTQVSSKNIFKSTGGLKQRRSLTKPTKFMRKWYRTTENWKRAHTIQSING